MSDPASSASASDESAVVPKKYLLPFILVTSLFVLWGFANDITNPMVAAFKNVLLLSNFESAWVQAAFYGGYCVMAIPAALFINRMGYKSGILVGLGLYVTGCLLFVPAGNAMQFWPFLMAYFVMTCGLSFLETTANPYILAMGPAHNAARRLNFAQAFNPMGSLLGMFVAKTFILEKLNEADTKAREALVETDPAAFEAIQKSDLDVIIGPYVVLGVVVLAVLVFFAFSRLPAGESSATLNPEQKSDRDQSLGAILGRLFSMPRYIGGVVAQAFYVGAQIMCWTFIIQYGVNELGWKKSEMVNFNMYAMAIFVFSRMICTYLMKFFNAGILLGILAIVGGGLLCGTIFVGGTTGLYCLMAVSACMSLMFPTIYGIALQGLGDDAKIASAGLILAIGGGSVMPPMQALIMDGSEWVIGSMTISATRASFVLPIICFVVIAIYGFMTAKSEEVA